MLNSKFQVGDLVRIRDDIPDRRYGEDGTYVSRDMYDHRGMVFEIGQVRGEAPHARYILAGPTHSFEGTWIWEDSFLDLAELDIEVDTTSLL